jgi:hypothetical protein
MLRFPLLKFSRCTEHESTPPAKYTWTYCSQDLICVVDSFRGSVAGEYGVAGTLKVLQRSDVLVCD